MKELLVLVALVGCSGGRGGPPDASGCFYLGVPREECTTEIVDGQQITRCTTVTPCLRCSGENHLEPLCVSGDYVAPCMEECPPLVRLPDAEIADVSFSDWIGRYTIDPGCDEAAGGEFITGAEIDFNASVADRYGFYVELSMLGSCSPRGMTCQPFTDVLRCDVIPDVTDPCIATIEIRRRSSGEIESSFTWLDSGGNDPAECSFVGTPQ